MGFELKFEDPYPKLFIWMDNFGSGFPGWNVWFNFDQELEL